MTGDRAGEPNNPADQGRSDTPASGVRTPTHEPNLLSADSLLWIVLFYVALSLVVTLPWLFHPKLLLGGPGDSWEYLWRLWWFKDSVFHGRNPFFAPQVFYPFGYNMAGGEITPGMMLAGLPLTALFGEVVAYNFLILSALVLAGLGMFLFARDVTQNPAASLLAGVIFAFSPFALTRAHGHLLLMGYCWLPILFWSLHRMNSEGRNRRWIARAVAAFTAMAYSSLHLAVISSVGVVVWFALGRVPGTGWAGRVRRYLAFGIPAGLLLIPLVAFYGHARAAGLETGHWSIHGIRGAPLLAFVLPSNLHPIFGRLTSLVLGSPVLTIENNVSFGVVALLFALWAIRTARREDYLVRACVWLAVVSVVLALGPVLMKNARELVQLPVALPPRILERFDPGGKLSRVPVPLPALPLALLPVFSGMRAYQRFAVLGSIAVALLAGIGCARIKSLKGARWRVAGPAAPILLVLLESAMWPFEITHPGPRPVDRWLHDIPGEFTILDFPLKTAENGPHMYYTRFHGKRIAGGYTTFPPRGYQEQADLLSRLPDSAAMPALVRAEVRYVLVDQRADTAAHLPGFLASTDFELAAVLDSISVFAVRSRVGGSAEQQPLH